MHTTIVTLTFLMLFNLNQAFLDNGTQEFRSIDDIDDSPALRIVRGKNAQPGQCPYQISFKRKLNWREFYTFCGGTLINFNTIISAAHCFVKKKMCDLCSKGKLSKSDLKHYWAVAGTFRTKDRLRGTGQWKKLVRVNYPTTYNFPKDDIAIVKLNTRVRYNMNVQPISYLKGPANLNDKTCVASGYGRMAIGRADEERRRSCPPIKLTWFPYQYLKMFTSCSLKKTPTYLQVGELVIMSQQQCNKWHGENMNKFICTSDIISDVAEGDSGGPLVCKGLGAKGENQWGVLVGVVCGRTSRGNTHSSYFTRITSFNRFLSSGGRNRGARSQGSPVLLVCFVSAIILYKHFTIVFEIALV